MRPVGVLLVVLCASALLIPRSASGQLSHPGSVTAVDHESVLGKSAADRLAPSANSVALLSLVRQQSEHVGEAPKPFTPLPQVRNGRGMPFMVAGGVLFVAGAIAGGDSGGLLMLGGAGVGAYGAFVYFGGN